MQKILLLFTALIGGWFAGQAQRTKAKPSASPTVDSIAFHLYTDSLKKGVHNYINVDGKLPGGGWYPLGAADIQFSSREAAFDGNSIVLPADFSKPYVVVTAIYKRNPEIKDSIRIYIKTVNDDGPLKTKEEIMQEIRQTEPARKKKRGNQASFSL